MSEKKIEVLMAEIHHPLEKSPVPNSNKAYRECFMMAKSRGGRVCLDNLKQFLSGKLLCLMPLPVSVVV
jgi:hypothetical protein